MAPKISIINIRHPYLNKVLILLKFFGGFVIQLFILSKWYNPFSKFKDTVIFELVSLSLKHLPKSLLNLIMI